MSFKALFLIWKAFLVLVYTGLVFRGCKQLLKSSFDAQIEAGYLREAFLDSSLKPHNNYMCTSKGHLQAQL
jgi:hypothetical protein